MNLELGGKAAIVTGGGKGIGRAIVERLLAEGADVLCVSRSAVNDAPGAAGAGRYQFFQADLTDLDMCRQAVAAALHHFGRLDVLVNNAGVNDTVGLSAGPAAFAASLAKNLLHYYAMAHHAADALKQSRGAIVNIGSKVAVTGQGGTSGYAAAKGAINALTREWAVELAPLGVRVNAVLPAETWTPLYDRLLGEAEDPAAAKAEIERLIPLERRFTTVEEMADTVVFVASGRASHTTGQILFVDGGYTHLDRKCTAG
ncbi:MAG: SDR family oxidoreductase [Planctomycetales bacterium]|nr:SDR family oxidoreductase [Planctomycetales bacterium]